MNSTIAKILLGVGVATALGACASLSEPHVSRADRYAQIHAGLTQDEVRSIAGKPLRVGTNPRLNETNWTYEYTDIWGYRDEFGVDFDNATGTVVETSSLPIDDN